MILPLRRRRRPLLETRERMIAETNAFLSWAVKQDSRRLRIPARRVVDGGFTEILRLPAAKAAVNHWWCRTLTDVVDRF